MLDVIRRLYWIAPLVLMIFGATAMSFQTVGGYVAGVCFTLMAVNEWRSYWIDKRNRDLSMKEK